MQFSTRLPAVLEDNALARALAARRAAGLPVLDLTVSDPTRVGLDYPYADIAAALAAGAGAAHAPHPRGRPEARAGIAGYYAENHGARVDAERVHLTASTSEGYGFLFKLLGDSGAEILAPQPSYPLIEHLATLDGWRARPYPLAVDPAGRWRVDLDALARAITPATRAIAMVHPHNPTGVFATPDEACALAELCAARGLALVADEVFLDYTTPDSAPRAGTLAAGDGPALTFTLSGLSKTCGMPQLKLGWIHTGGPRELVAAAQARLDFIADAYLSVATPVQAAAGKLFAVGAGVRAQIAARVEANAAALAANAPAGFSVAKRAGGWQALVRGPAAPDEEALARRLVEHAGVLAHPGYFYDFAESGWLVLSLLPEPAIFGAGLAALREWLPKLV
jgi:alanine-synthesizing transaminase